MRIRCDFCDQQDAIVFCSADEAALCDTCDRRVHRANKVAQRHHRFSLVHPSSSSSSSSSSPLCDVCQERRAMLFCREDRAILCKECDYPIHTTNEQTRKHCRFLLTGVKVTPIAFCEVEECVSVEKRTNACVKNRRAIDHEVESQVETTSLFASGCVCSSSISEYLETLPGWHVEEFFDHLHDLC